MLFLASPFSPAPVLSEPFITHSANVTAGAISDDGEFAASATDDEICVWDRSGRLIVRNTDSGTRYLDWSPRLKAFRAGRGTANRRGYRIVGTDGTVRDAPGSTPDDRNGPGRFEVLTLPNGNDTQVVIHDRLEAAPDFGTTLTNINRPATWAYSGVTKKLYVGDSASGGTMRIQEVELAKDKVRLIGKGFGSYGQMRLDLTPDGRTIVIGRDRIDVKNGKVKTFADDDFPAFGGVTDFTAMTWNSGRFIVTDLKTGKSQNPDVFPESERPEMAYPSFDGKYALVRTFAPAGEDDDMANRALRLWGPNGTRDLVNEELSGEVRRKMAEKSKRAERRAEETGRSNVPAPNGTEADYRRWLDANEGAEKRDGARLLMSSPSSMPTASFGGSRWISEPFDIPIGSALVILTGAPLPTSAKFPFKYTITIQEPREGSSLNWDSVGELEASGNRGINGDRMCSRFEYNYRAPKVGPGQTYDRTPKRVRILFVSTAPIDAEVKVYLGPEKKKP